MPYVLTVSNRFIKSPKVHSCPAERSNDGNSASIISDNSVHSQKYSWKEQKTHGAKRMKDEKMTKIANLILKLELFC